MAKRRMTAGELEDERREFAERGDFDFDEDPRWWDDEEEELVFDDIYDQISAVLPFETNWAGEAWYLPSGKILMHSEDDWREFQVFQDRSEEHGMWEDVVQTDTIRIDQVTDYARRASRR